MIQTCEEQMNWIAVALAIFGLGFGLASAWFWEASSQVPLTDSTTPPIITAEGPVITPNHLQRYLRRVSALNKWAAIFGDSTKRRINSCAESRALWRTGGHAGDALYLVPCSDRVAGGCAPGAAHGTWRPRARVSAVRL